MNLKNVSRLYPGKADYLGIKNLVGVGVHEQKPLILLSLKRSF